MADNEKSMIADDPFWTHRKLCPVAGTVTGFLCILGRFFDLSFNLQELLNLVLQQLHSKKKKKKKKEESRIMTCRQFWVTGYFSDTMYVKTDFPL